MPVAAKSILQELSAVFSLIFMVLMLITVGGRFSGYLDEVVNNRIPLEVLWTILLLRLPDFIQLVIPLSLFLGILITISRFHSEQEFSVLLMGGLSPVRLSIWLAIVILPLTLLVGVLSLWVGPWATAEFDRVMSQAKSRQNVSQFPAERISTFDDGRQMIYVSEVDRQGQRLEEIVYAKIDDAGLEVARAGSAQLTSNPNQSVNTKYLTLQNGHYQTTNFDTKDVSSIHFKEFRQRLTLDALPLPTSNATLATLSLNLRDPRDLTELHWRIALPILTLIASLCAIGIAKVPPRRGRYSQIAPGLAIFVAYLALIVIGRGTQDFGLTVAWLGLVPIHLIFLLAGCYLVRRSWLPT